MYKAKIIADSLSSQGKRLTTYVVTYPRIVHAEMCRHRMHSRNTASSRAIPFEKMVKEVEENPFIPIAWQKAHKGMQGTEYFTDEVFEASDGKFPYVEAIKNEWNVARNKAIEQAKELYKAGVTKQLCNRLLEPFVWVTEIISGTEWDNFFELRCPSYFGKYKSWKDACVVNGSLDWDTPFHLRKNESQADIHIQAIAELMWDAYNESKPKKLESGEFHLPFGDNITDERIWPFIKHEDEIESIQIKIATARCARVSYLNFEGRDDYEADIKLHDRLRSMKHWSPFEHCARAMSDVEFEMFYNGKSTYQKADGGLFPYESYGWCRNFKGFIQYRHLIEE